MGEGCQSGVVARTPSGWVFEPGDILKTYLNVRSVMLV